jgi:hypothetical protein
MRLFPALLLVFLFFAGLWVSPATAQITSAGSGAADPGTFSKTDASGVAWPGVTQSGADHSGVDRSGTLGPTISLLASSTMNVVSEMGGAFRSGSKCDGDGNLYIRKQAMDRPLLGPVVKIDPKGKRTALFDPAAFSQLALDRADAFSPAPDGGIYQIASRMLASQDGLKQRIYVLHFAPDGSASSPILLDADFEVYTFAAFAEGNFLVSGMRRDALNKNDHGRNFTAVFSADGRELAQLSFPKAGGSGAKAEGKSGAKEGSNESRSESRNEFRNDGETAAPTLDLAEAEVGRDGNLYVMRAASPTLIYVIAATGQIMKTLKIAGPAGAMANGFHVSGNRLALLFWDEANESQMMVIADAQTGRKIASYANSSALGQSFACYSADEGVFTFLRLGEGNALEVIRAEPQ